MTKILRQLSVDAIRKLRDDHEQLRLEVRALRLQLRAAGTGFPRCPCDLVIGKTDAGGIDASTTDEIKAANVTLCVVQSGGTTIQETGRTVRCHNMAGAVDGSEYILMSRDSIGRYWVIVERC